jgi:glycosyltransferase involved in cell wall biosynthesis
VGAELSQGALVNALARRGHEVHVSLAAREAGAVVASLDDVPWLTFEPQVRVHFVSDPAMTKLCDPDVVFGRELPGALTVRELRGGVRLRDAGAGAFAHRWPMTCVSRWLLDLAVAHGVERRRLAYVPNGVDHGVFRVATPQAQRPRRVAMLHHPAANKGSEDGLAAIAEVRRTLPDVEAVVYGARRPDHELPAWARFHFRPDLATLVDDVYNGAQVFLQPSRSEGFPRPGLEAMASGCAVVTADNGGCREYAVDGITALVTPPGDVPAMAGAVVRLLEDDALRHTIAAQGVAHAAQFDWDRSGALLERFLVDYVADPDRYLGQDTTAGTP